MKHFMDIYSAVVTNEKKNCNLKKIAIYSIFPAVNHVLSHNKLFIYTVGYRNENWLWMAHT